MKPLLFFHHMLLIIIVFLSACQQDSQQQIDSLFSEWDKDQTPGAAIAVVKDGSIVYEKGYGTANLEYDIPITPTSVFHIASVSKQFTVFSVLLLEKEGKLSLDDDIRKYIPEVPDFGKTITLHHLASHTSGMRDQWNLLSMSGWRMDDVITKEHVLKLVSKQKELNFDPGEEFLYCNTGFTLLAEAVARVSGQSFADFTHQNIFEPLGMSQTLFYDDHEKIVENRAYSYYKDSTGYKKSVLNYANVGATSLFTTVEDLSCWAMNFSSPKVGDTTIFNKMNTLAVLNNGEKFGGALGQFVGQYKGLNEISHGGADAGYRTFLTRFPDQHLSVIVFSNLASFDAGGMAHKIADIYLANEIQAEPEQETKTKKTNSEEVTISEESLQAYAGEYELQPGIIISITEEQGKLFGKATNQPKVALKALSDSEFEVEGENMKVEFSENNQGKAELLKLYADDQTMEAHRMQAFDPAAVDLSEFTGRYFSEELSTEYQFKVVDGQLMAQHSRLSDFKLTPVKPDTFNSDAWFFGTVEFVRDSTQQITGCKVSSGRVRNLQFQKMG